MNELIELSQKILGTDKNNDTNFSINKKIILSLFIDKEKLLNNNKSDILLLLTVIDSFYSTNMSKRYFGLEELTKGMLELEKKNIIEKIKKEGVNYFIKNYLGNILDRKNGLGHIGIGKQGNKSGHALSLITKYLYFRTNFNFPIYDNLVLNELKINNIKVSLENNENNYFKILDKIKNDFNVSFDILDRVLWLSGKIRKGNFGLIFEDKNSYIDFLKELGLNELSDNSKIELLNNLFKENINTKKDFNKKFGEIILMKINKYDGKNEKIRNINKYSKIIQNLYI